MGGARREGSARGAPPPPPWGLTNQVEGTLVVGDSNIGLRGREVVSPSHLHSDPIQVFDVEQQQTQDPVGSRQGSPVGSTDAHVPISVSLPTPHTLATSASSPRPFPLGLCLGSSPLQIFCSLLRLGPPHDPPLLAPSLTSCSRHCVLAQHTQGLRP